MVAVLWGLLPIAVSSVYFFGWRAGVMLLWCNAVAFFCERLFSRRYHEPVSSAVFVTGTLFAMSLPPLLPFWMAAVGVAFGIIFGKMVFGGFGRNVFNPALTGRAFIYISFGGPMTAQCWTHPLGGPAGGFLAWTAALPDAITSATPGTWLKMGAAQLAEMGVGPEHFTWQSLLLGNSAGCIGGTSAVLVLLGGAWIIWKKAASHRIVIGCLAGYVLCHTLLWSLGAGKAVAPHLAVLAGSGLIGFFFYATDPVSACKTNPGRWFYGLLIGVLSSLITAFSVWPAGTMFAVLIANMFAPIIDISVRGLQQRRAAKP